MDISAQRIELDIQRIAKYSESPPEIGYSRPTFSDAWRAAREYVIDEARRAGGQDWTDAAGNLHIRHASQLNRRPVWLTGSHLDSVPTGGMYDGVVGVVIPLEIMRSHAELPLELIVFAEEEGTTFQLGMIGSHAWLGDLDVDQLDSLVNREGISYREAGAATGVDPAALRTGRLIEEDYLGFIEVHVEQGPALWRAGQPVGLVRSIHGRRQFTVCVQGSANHAGSTPMANRQDALAGAALMVLELECLARSLDHEHAQTVITVGRLFVHPNALNVIPGSATFTIDFRASSDVVLDRGEQEIRARLAECARQRNVGLSIERTEALSAIPLDETIGDQLRAAARRIGYKLPDLFSGALHDAAIVARRLPTAMLFVASRDGISHHPQEFSRTSDIELAARLLAEFFVQAENMGN